MAISEVIKFEGSPDDLVWKYPGEDFTTTSQLIVDETHEALFVINGNAADLFGPGRRTLSTNNIPILNKLINIPTGGVSPFPSKVFYINKVHQMDIKWGTKSPIPLEDPLYDIFMHVMVHGSTSVSVSDSRKFMLKLVGFRDSFSAEDLVQKFRGIIDINVKDLISKIMINGQLSYFMISANMLDISAAVKEKLDSIFLDYGVTIEFFNIETIEVPEADYAKISEAKSMRSSRMIQGYTWQEERQMAIAEKFAGNEGTMGAMGGALGGAMGGVVMGNSISEIAHNALNSENNPTQAPPKDVTGTKPPMGANSPRNSGPFDVNAFLKGGTDAENDKGVKPASDDAHILQEKENNTEAADSERTGNSNGGIQASNAGITEGRKFCPNCGAEVSQTAKFCEICGQKLETERHCPNCGSKVNPHAKFCANCGTRLD
jgi:membrane protease subunit (stomatin/prohibitin family)